MNIWILLAAVLSGSALTLLSVFLGAYIMHKGSQTGTPFLSSGKGGEVFRVPFPEDTPDFPEDEIAKEKLAKRTTEFLKNLGGK